MASQERCVNMVFTARCDASAVFAVTQCLSVTFVDHVKTNKDIFEFFSPSDSDRHSSSFFNPKGAADIPTGTPLTGRRMQGGMIK